MSEVPLDYGSEVIMNPEASLVEAFQPPRPRNLKEAGLSRQIIEEMILKIMHFSSQLAALDMATKLRLDYECIHEAVQSLTNGSYLQAIGPLNIGNRQTNSLGEKMGFEITAPGRERARGILERNQYMGPAPVPLAAYNRSVTLQSLPDNFATKKRVLETYKDLVLNSETLDLLGPALNSRSSIFLYGNPGNGKSSIARTAQNLLEDSIYIPYAISVDDQAVRLFDPSHHEPFGEAVPEADQRWIRVKRPFVQVGGELDLSMLDLTWQETFKFYEAGLQMKANGGIFLVDDFGRQDVSPRKLLNRFIVPLEEGTDFLNMSVVGKKIEVPFGMLIFFSTNMDPSQLVDEAFLRRIRYKIYIPDPTDEEFIQIFINEARAAGLKGGETSAPYVLGKYYNEERRPRGVHPRDLLAHVKEFAAYNDQPASLNKTLLDKACSTYFLLEKTGNSLGREVGHKESVD
jgi:hypothetical protein